MILIPSPRVRGEGQGEGAWTALRLATRRIAERPPHKAGDNDQECRYMTRKKPREVRERLRLKPGDTLRHRMTKDGVLFDKAPANEADDPFATFSEWSHEADEKAYGDL